MRHLSRRARRVTSLLSVLVLAAVVLSLSPTPTPTQAANPPPRRGLGVFTGSSDPARVEAFSRFVGSPVTDVHTFFHGSSWATMMKNAPGQIRARAGTPYTKLYSLPMLTNDGGTLAQGAAGRYDHHFRELARLLVAGDQKNAIIRPGWEHNGTWFRWTSTKDPAAYAAYFRRIVTVMRSVPGAGFLRFDWTVGSLRPADPASYPGDAYVEFVGMDVYDKSYSSALSDPAARWNAYLTRPGGLRWHRDFAAAHGAHMTFPEWGLSSTHAPGVVADNPYFIRQMRDWFAQNDVMYAHYFNVDSSDGAHSLYGGRFPRAAQAMKESF